MRYSGSPKVLWILIFAVFTGGCSRPASTEQALFTEKYGDFSYCEMTAVRQSHSKSCGSASLTAMLNYWQIETTERQLLEEFGKPPKEGFSMAHLLAIAKSRDIQAYAFSMTPLPLEKLTEQIQKGRPVICIVRMPQALYIGCDVPLFSTVYRRLSWMLGPRKNHFVVVFGFKDEQFLLMDPAFGFTTFSSNQLADAWGRQKNLAILLARLSD